MSDKNRNTDSVQQDRKYDQAAAHQVESIENSGQVTNEELAEFAQNNRDVLDLLARVRDDRKRSSNDDRDEAKQVELDTDQFQAKHDTGHDLLTVKGNAQAGKGSANWADLMPKQIGRFVLHRLLGQGGFGMVFLATDPQLKREVALKVPKPNTLFTPDLRDRFIREATYAAALNHANIVPIYEAGEAGSIAYSASAVCHGLTLDDWRKQLEQAPSPKQCAKIIETLASAVQHAHSRDVIHRDLKPSNIIMQPGAADESVGSREKTIAEPDEDSNSSPPTSGDKESSTEDSKPTRDTATEYWSPIITDFGLAKFLNEDQDVTRTGAIVGTPAYMSPEQAKGKQGNAGRSSDIYALGGMLYFLLVGKSPFSKESILETLRAVQDEPVASPRSFRKEIPRDLEAICLKCLEKKPSQRYESASELQADLIRFLQDQPVVARQKSTMDRVWSWCRRRPAISSLAAALLLVMALSSIVLSLLLAESHKLRTQAIDSGNQAKVAAKDAEAQRDLARKALDDMTGQVAADLLVGQDELTPQQRRFIENTIGYYRDFANLEIKTDEDRIWVVSAEQRLGDLLFRLGEYETAAQVYIRQLDHMDEFEDPTSIEDFATQNIEALIDLQTCYMYLGEVDNAYDVAIRSVKVADEWLDEAPDEPDLLRRHSKAVGNLAITLRQNNQYDEALRIGQLGIDEQRKLIEEYPEVDNFKRDLSISILNRANLLGQNFKRFEDAINLLHEALDIRRAIGKKYPGTWQLEADIAFALDSLGAVYFMTRDNQAADEAISEALEIRLKNYEAFPSDDQLRQSYIKTLTNAIPIFHRVGREQQAFDLAQQLVDLSDQFSAERAEIPSYRFAASEGRKKLGGLLIKRGEYEQAIEALSKAIQTFDTLEGLPHLKDLIHNSVLDSYRDRAIAYEKLNELEQASADWESLYERVSEQRKPMYVAANARVKAEQGKAQEALSLLLPEFESSDKLSGDVKDHFELEAAMTFALLAKHDEPLEVETELDSSDLNLGNVLNSSDCQTQAIKILNRLLERGAITSELLLHSDEFANFRELPQFEKQFRSE